MILLDTNVLVRTTNSADPGYTSARHAIDALRTRSERLLIVPQTLYEFWSVATRRPGKAPTGQSGLGMNPSRVRAWMQFFRRKYVLLVDRAELNTVWQDLVADRGISGFKSHDARLVAAVMTYQVPRILTFNTNDFTTFGAVTLHPNDV